MKARSAIAIEAASDQFSIAVSCADRVLCWESQPARDASPRVFEHCQRLLDELGGDFGALEFVAFGCGPGSFTGVRVAAAAAQALAFAHDIPVCRVSSLRVLAASGCRARGSGSYAVCLDARMQHVYVALYRADLPRAVEAEFADALMEPDRFMVPGDSTFVAVGEGWQAYPALLARHGSRVSAVLAGLRPSALDLLELARADFVAGRTVSATDALPEYLGQRPAHQK